LTVFGDVSVGTRSVLEKTLRSEVPVSQTAPASNPAANVAAGFDPKTASRTSPTPYITELVTLLIGSPEFQQR